MLAGLRGGTWSDIASSYFTLGNRAVFSGSHIGRHLYDNDDDDVGKHSAIGLAIQVPRQYEWR